MPKTIIGSAIASPRLIQAVPISIAAQPTIARRALLWRRVSRGVTAAAANAAAVTGRNARPASSGLSRRTPCRYWVMKKKKLTSTPLNRKRAA